jgi:hypothetical protein
MRLNAEAVVCTGNREWYYGSLSGFTFFIKDKILSKNRFKEPNRFKSVTNWIQELGYKKDCDILSKTLLKSITLRDINNTDSPLNFQKGVIRLFIGRSVTIGYTQSKKYNVLCANCIWTCKQLKESKIRSCKAFKNGTPVR